MAASRARLDQGSRVTVRDVASLAGVSAITVSRVINNASNVSEATRQRVQDAAKKLQYHPDQSARSLVAKRTGCIAIAIPRSTTFLFENPFFSVVLRGITEAAEARGIRVVLSTLDGPNNPLSLHRMRVVDGAVLLAVRRSERTAHAMYQERVPFVVLNRFLDVDDLSFVDVDNRGGAFAAVQHLIDRGRHRIGFVSGVRGLSNCEERYRGFRDAIDRVGEFDEQLVVEAEFSESAGYKAAKALIARGVDAIFATSDIAAVGAIFAVRDAGLSVPGDVAVVGFDDVPVGRYVVPRLTTVSQPAREKGFLAASALLDILDGSAHAPVQVVLPTRLVVRESS